MRTRTALVRKRWLRLGMAIGGCLAILATHPATALPVGAWGADGLPQQAAVTAGVQDGLDTAQDSPEAAGAQVPDTAAAPDTAVAPDTLAAPDTASAPEPVPPSRAQEDEEIRSRLQAVFDRVESLQGVSVRVDAGIVHLGGTVSQSRAADQAAELARSQEGVIFVDDQIQETASVSARLRPTWERLGEIGIGFIAALPLIGVAVIVLLLFSALGSLIGRWRMPQFLHERNPFLQGLVRRLLQVAAVLAGLLIALQILDATALVGAVIGTAGLAGLAFGFAFKDIAENYLAGVLLSFSRPFEKNDHVLVGGFEGKVVRLTARETVLMTLDGNHVQIPNGVVVREAVLNYTRNPRRRFAFGVDVAPETDLPAALDAGIRTLRAMTGVMDEPAPMGVIRELGDSTVGLRFFGWVDQREADFARVQSEAIRLVKTAFDDAGIDMPSPEYRVAMGREEAPAAEPTRPSRREPATVAERVVESEQRDVSVDTTIDEQIEEERRSTGETDLLSQPAADAAEEPAPEGSAGVPSSGEPSSGAP